MIKFSYKIINKYFSEDDTKNPCKTVREKDKMRFTFLKLILHLQFIFLNPVGNIRKERNIRLKDYHLTSKHNLSDAHKMHEAETFASY